MKEYILQNRVLSVLARQGWNTTGIERLQSSKGSGLLNPPVIRYYVSHDGQRTQVAVKVVEQEPRLLFRRLYRECGHASEEQLNLFDRCCPFLSINKMPEREGKFYCGLNDIIKPYVPRMYGVGYSDKKLLLVMEDLSYCECMDAIDNPLRWQFADVMQIIKTLALFHHTEIYYEEMFPSWNDSDNWELIANFLAEFNGSMAQYAQLTKERKISSIVEEYIRNLEQYEHCLRQYRTIYIHNDFNIRNICLSRQEQKIKVYDWEFLDKKNPIMDLVDLFLSLATEYLEKENLDRLLKMYMEQLSEYGEDNLGSLLLKEQIYYNTLKFSATRMNMYLLFYIWRKTPYIVRMCRNLVRLLSYCSHR